MLDKPRLTAVALAACLGGLAYASEDLAEAELRSLEGDWAIVSCESEGRVTVIDQPEPQTGFSGWRFKAGKLYGVVNGKAVWEASVRLDTTPSPKTIQVALLKPVKDLPAHWGKRGIYQLTGDVLEVCYAPDKEPLPKGFDTEGTMTWVVTMKRVHQAPR
jgi:uncharacterized protein (TIGR03067 family)